MKYTNMLAGLLFAAPVFAGGFAPAQAPSEFEFGVIGQAWRLSDSRLQYGVIGPAATFPTGDSLILRPDYKFSYGAHARYSPKNNQNDVEVGFNYFNSSDSASAGNNGQTIYNTQLPAGFAGASTSTSAAAHLDYDLTTIYVNVGREINTLESLRLRIFAGGQYTYLRHNFQIDYAGIGVGTGTGQVKQKTRFNGIGPVFGMDTVFSLTDQVGIVGRVSTALLAGDVHSSHFAQGPLATHIMDIDDPRQTRLIPNLGARVGFNAHWQMNDKCKFIVELGYSAQEYFDVITTNAFNHDTTSAASRDGHNIGFHGPYGMLRIIS